MKSFLKCSVGFLCWASLLAAGDNERTVVATRTSIAPRLDGFLTEEVWQTAPAATDFLQRDPDEGRPETGKTEIRILYDHEALYFGCMMHDAEPDKIVARLTRRDNEIDSDLISVRLDSYHDHKTAFEFTVLASGVKIDILQYNDGEDEDDSWDAVWEVETQILRGLAQANSLHGRAESASAATAAAGWSAEIKIPFNVLRYSPAKDGNNVWGLNLIRRVSRKNERDEWALVGKDQSGYISHYGHLLLAGQLPHPKTFQLLPYTVGRGEVRDRALAQPASATTNFNGDAGFDLKYGLNSSLTLDLTMNPDFGQVEADPEVLNLTTFETFYPEKRPFFLES